MTHVRKPACESCPLNKQRKVWGEGPLDAEWLIVAEAPGPDEEEDGRPLIGPSGYIFETTCLLPAKLPRKQVRIENVNQCRAPAESPRGRQAQLHCGPSLMDVVRAMPNLKWIITMGEPALEWVSGWKPWQLRNREQAKAIKAWERKFETYQRKQAEHAQKHREWEEAYHHATNAGKKFKRKPPKPPTDPGPRPADPEPETGYHTVTLFRGSQLDLTLEGHSFKLYPVLHPASVMAFRQPRLRPLLTMDFIKAVQLARGERVVPPMQMRYLRTGRALRDFMAELGKGRVSLDLEWSRRLNELQCLALGAGDKVGLVPWRDLLPVERSGLYVELQAAFDNPAFEWGGHFAEAYDRCRLEEMGLRIRMAWDSLYGFHIGFAELGSVRDEANPDLTQASGYDLAFVTSVLTPFPYHKIKWGERDAADIGNPELYPYCAQDTRASWYAMDAIAREFEVRYGKGGEPGHSLMRADMRRSYLAQFMGQAGVPILADRRKRAIKWLEAELGVAEEACRDATHPEFNPHSTQQLERELTRQGIRLAKRTATGKAALDSKVVDTLVDKHPDHPLLSRIGRLRAVKKELAVYEGSPKSLVPNERGVVPVSWKVHGTVGARWSSSPNVQNLSTLPKLIVGCEGYEVVVADLDAAELRIVAVVAGQTDLLDMMARGESSHLEVAKQLFGRTISKSNDREEYVFAKSCTYRWMYTLPDEPLNMEGGQLRTYRVEVPPSRLAYISHWLARRYGAISRWKRDTINQIDVTGFSRSPHGRMRDLRWAIRNPAKALKAAAHRAGLNFPIQSTCGEVVGQAFEALYDPMLKLGGRVFANEHDSLACLVPPDHVGPAKMMLKEVLEKPVPELGGYVIPASVKVGLSWGEAE